MLFYHTECDYTNIVGTMHAAIMANPETYLYDFVIATGIVDKTVSKAEAYLSQVLKKGTQTTTFLACFEIISIIMPRNHV